MGFVYALQMGETDSWKIGWVKSRESLVDHLARLQRGCRERLTVRALKRTRMAEKNQLRWEMVTWWCGGDWYQWNEGLKQLVDDYPFHAQAVPKYMQDQ